MNYSLQRELVKDILKNRTDHPTADMVYSAARGRAPQISLATVYRNLKTLAESGEILTLETADNKLHYDGNVTGHSHFICKGCGRIFDVWATPRVPEELAQNGFTVTESKNVYYGFCGECAKKNSKKAGNRVK